MEKPIIRRMATKKSFSWWWDSHMSPKNSKWLAENLEEMDQSVKRMLKLIEEEGDSFAKKAEMYYEKRPELISHVEDFYRRYRSLAERYDHVTGELRKNIPSELQPQGSGSDLASELTTPSPGHKHPRQKASRRAAGFNVFLGSGGSSDLSPKGSDRPSSSSDSSDSGSDSDEATSKSCSTKASENNGVEDGNLQHRIFELENELKFMKEKLQAAEAENTNALLEASEKNCNELLGKISELEQQLKITNEKLKVSEKEIVRLKDELNNNKAMDVINGLESELESLRQEKGFLESEFSLAQKQIISLEAELESSRKESKQFQDALELEKTRASKLQEQFASLEANVVAHESKLEEMAVGMSDESEKHAKEKLVLEAHVLVLSDQCAANEAKIRELESKSWSLDDTVAQLEAEKLEMQVKIERGEYDNAEKSQSIQEVNRRLDALQLKYDTLMAEKDTLGAKLLHLAAEICSRDDRIREMNEHLKSLHLEHACLITSTQNAQKLANELRMRVQELEEEVERQRAVIADSAEEKREAIRQLCFSLDHYRDGYLQLRQALHGHKRHAVVAV